jgi:hypothetical protein
MITDATSVVGLKKLNEALVKIMNLPVARRLWAVSGLLHLLYFVVEAGEVSNVR